MKNKELEASFQAFLNFMLVCFCAANPLIAASNAEASNGVKLVTPTAQTEQEEGATLAAPSNARPPVAIDTSDLKPTLFKPVLEALEAIQAAQLDAQMRLEAISAQRPNADRSDEILAAIRGINERQVTIKGWSEQKEAFDGLRSFLEGLRERLANVATVDDVQNAVDSIQIPEPNIDFESVAREETLLALGERFPTIENIREISGNLASLTARLDELAAQVEQVDVDAEVAKLRRELQIVILVAAIILAVIIIQCATLLIRWIISFSKAAKDKAVAAQDAWLNKKLESFLAAREEKADKS